MTTEERIERLKPYFVSFQIDSADNAIILLIKFPTDAGWRLPKVEDTKTKYKTEFAQTESGIYFGTDISNGSDILFDCVESIIKDNKTAQEKKNLFSKKVEELKLTFSREPLDKLYFLSFTFSEPIDASKEERKEENGKGKKDKGKKRKTETVEVVVEEKAKEDKELLGDDNDSDLMSFAKGLISEE